MVGTVTESRFEGIRLEVLSRLQVDVRDVMASYEKGGSVGCSVYLSVCVSVCLSVCLFVWV